MGWNSASSIVNEMIALIKTEIPDLDRRKALYMKMIVSFEAKDWDTQEECLGRDTAYDEALKELHPDFFEEEEGDE